MSLQCQHKNVTPDIDAYKCCICGTRIYALKASQRVGKRPKITAEELASALNADQLERDYLRYLHRREGA